VEGSRRFFLADHTARDGKAAEGWQPHPDLEQSSAFVLNIMRWVNGYNDGVRRNMSSPERAQIANQVRRLGDSRHEAGIMLMPE